MADLTKPSAQEVKDLHTNADTDGERTSAHHTLGPRHNQSSPGDHTHDGGDSKLLLDGITITGAKGGNTALANVISILVNNFGATDGTTA